LLLYYITERTQVDGELPVETLRLERADCVRLEHRGVVDQQGQRPDRVGRRRHEAGGFRMIGEVRAQHGGAPASTRDLVAQRLCFRDRAVRLDGDRVTRPMQRQRDRAADAARPPGHQRGAWSLIGRTLSHDEQICFACGIESHYSISSALT